MEPQQFLTNSRWKIFNSFDQFIKEFLTFNLQLIVRFKKIIKFTIFPILTPFHLRFIIIKLDFEYAIAELDAHFSKRSYIMIRRKRGRGKKRHRDSSPGIFPRIDCARSRLFAGTDRRSRFEDPRGCSSRLCAVKRKWGGPRHIRSQRRPASDCHRPPLSRGFIDGGTDRPPRINTA